MLISMSSSKMPAPPASGPLYYLSFCWNALPLDFYTNHFVHLVRLLELGNDSSAGLTTPSSMCLHLAGAAGSAGRVGSRAMLGAGALHPEKHPSFFSFQTRGLSGKKPSFP